MECFVAKIFDKISEEDMSIAKLGLDKEIFLSLASSTLMLPKIRNITIQLLGSHVSS